MIRARPMRACAVVLACVFAAAAAQAAQTDREATFESLDRNGDSQVSVAEASENDALFVAFKNLDKNRDGELTRDEFAKYQPQKTRTPTG